MPFRAILGLPRRSSSVQACRGFVLRHRWRAYSKRDATKTWPVASNPDSVTLPGLDQKSSKSRSREPPEIKPQGAPLGSAGGSSGRFSGGSLE